MSYPLPYDYDTPELVMAVQAGDKQAYRRLVDQYMPLVYGLAYARTPEPAAARQAALEFFAAAYRHMWSASRRNFARWILTQFPDVMLTEDFNMSGDLLDPQTEPPYLDYAERETLAVYFFTGCDIGHTAHIQRIAPEDVRRRVASLIPEEGPKKCRNRTLLPILLDENIPHEDEELLTLHLAGCENCRLGLETLRQNLDRLKHEFSVELPYEAAVDSMISQLPDAPPEPPVQPAPIRVITFAWVFTSIILLVAILLLLIRGPG